MTDQRPEPERKPSNSLVPLPKLPARSEAEELAQGLPGLARVAVTSSWKTFSWAVGSTMRAGGDIVRRTLDGEPPASILHDTTEELRHVAWKALGLAEQKPTPEGGEPREPGDGGVVDTISNAASGMLGALGAFGPAGLNRTGGWSRDTADLSGEQLLARGRQLLDQSADVDVSEEGHPAYVRILSEITPDEARILRFLYREGPQPAIDIRTNRPFGIGSELVAAGFSMIAEYAGLRHLDRIHPYLINLNRLGLIDFSKETVRNPNRYQVIEAQPQMTEAMKKAGRAPKIVRKSIQINPFGEEFCKTCLFGDDESAASAKATDEER